MASLTAQQRLDAAEDAYHRLMMGQSARVIVDQSGERIEYTAANAPRLQAYIELLKRELGLIPAGGPAGVFF